MKNTSIWLAFIAFSAFTLGCDNCKDNCSSEVSISTVLPNSNPVGYEVLLKTDGFSNAAQVLFGTEKASSRPGGNVGEIIAKVPAGLSGNVEISLEEGDCIRRSGGFIVLNSLPSNVQPSLPDIIIPIPASSIPLDGIENDWTNGEDKTRQGIHLQGPWAAGFYQLDGSKEFGDDPYFEGNPVSGTINTNTNVINLEVDRTAKIGGSIEHFDGLFIEKPNFLPASSKPAILLVSRETGRQLLLYYPG